MALGHRLHAKRRSKFSIGLARKAYRIKTFLAILRSGRLREPLTTALANRVIALLSETGRMLDESIQEIR